MQERVDFLVARKNYTLHDAFVLLRVIKQLRHQRQSGQFLRGVVLRAGIEMYDSVRDLPVVLWKGGRQRVRGHTAGMQGGNGLWKRFRPTTSRSRPVPSACASHPRPGVRNRKRSGTGQPRPCSAAFVSDQPKQPSTNRKVSASLLKKKEYSCDGALSRSCHTCRRSRSKFARRPTARGRAGLVEGTLANQLRELQDIFDVMV